LRMFWKELSVRLGSGSWRGSQTPIVYTMSGVLTL
jgi:hypothetical protein